MYTKDIQSQFSTTQKFACTKWLSLKTVLTIPEEDVMTVKISDWAIAIIRINRRIELIESPQWCTLAHRQSRVAWGVRLVLRPSPIGLVPLASPWIHKTSDVFWSVWADYDDMRQGYHALEFYMGRCTWEWVFTFQRCHVGLASITTPFLQVGIVVPRCGVFEFLPLAGAVGAHSRTPPCCDGTTHRLQAPL